jgi:hypothetical protein
VRLTHTYLGGAIYSPDYEAARHTLLVAIPCLVGDLIVPLHTLLDTASQWCLLPPRIALDLGCDLEPDPSIPPLHTRFGLIYGHLERLSLRFLAEAGEDLVIEATWFLSQDWPGPMVIGWKGGLERIRFALDPSEDAFYFAPL